MKRVISLIVMLALCAFCMTGCSSENLLRTFETRITLLHQTDEGLVTREVENSVMEEYLSDIKIAGMPVALPMKVSDLPEDMWLVDIGVAYPYLPEVSYNGYVVLGAEIYSGNCFVTYAQILCRGVDDVENGVIVGLELSSFYAMFSVGDISSGMTLQEADMAMGFDGNTEGKDVLFTAPNGYSIYYYIFGKESTLNDILYVSVLPDIYSARLPV